LNLQHLIQFFLIHISNIQLTKGRWTHHGNSIKLNENLKERDIQVDLTEGIIDSQDYITVKFNYILEEYVEEVLASSELFEFKMLTLKLNGKNKGYNFMYRKTHRMCLFSPKIKNQVIIDSTNTAQIPRKDLESISINSYGFKEEIIMKIENEKTNYLEINIVKSIDKERIPRNNEVIIKGDKAFYYERDGKIVTSGTLSSPLVKIN